LAVALALGTKTKKKSDPLFHLLLIDRNAAALLLWFFFAHFCLDIVQVLFHWMHGSQIDSALESKGPAHVTRDKNSCSSLYDNNFLISFFFLSADHCWMEGVY
jgi:hypothetical protein